MQEQAPPERTLSIREAAHYFGLGETTIRRRIHSGELRAFKQQTAYGIEWRIVIPGGEGVATGGGGASTTGAASERVALALVEENRRLQEQAPQLAGRIGWLESQLQLHAPTSNSAALCSTRGAAGCSATR
jgi:excisionase family DNA binding protein